MNIYVFFLFIYYTILYNIDGNIYKQKAKSSNYNQNIDMYCFYHSIAVSNYFKFHFKILF